MQATPPGQGFEPSLHSSMSVEDQDYNLDFDNRKMKKEEKIRLMRK